MWRSIVATAIVVWACGPALGAVDVEPRIEVKDGTPVVVLPDSLKAAMRKYNSKMQLWEWSEYDPDLVKWFRKEYPKAVPWATWGDFDGNGRTDVVLQMCAADARLFKLVTSHQRPDGGWRPHLLGQYRRGANDPPIVNGISCLILAPGGQSIHYWPEYDKAKQVRTESDLPRMWLQHDAITNVAFGKVAVTYYWKRGKYHSIITAD